MYIRGLIPRIFAELAVAVLIAEGVGSALRAASQLPGMEPTDVDESKAHNVMKKMMLSNVNLNMFHH